MLEDSSIKDLIKNHRKEILEEMETTIKQFPVPRDGYKQVKMNEGFVSVNLGKNKIGTSTWLDIPNELVNEVSIFKKDNKIDASFTPSLTGNTSIKPVEFPQSGHLIDHFLRSRDKKEKILKTVNKKVFSDKKIITDIDRIRLPVLQRKIVNSIYMYLFKSKDIALAPKEALSFKDIAIPNKDIELPLIELRINRGDFYRDILGKQGYSSEQQKIIHKNMDALRTTNFNVLQKFEYEITKKGKKEKRYDIIAEQMSLILRLQLVMEGLTEDEAERQINGLFKGGVDQTKGAGDFIITPNPIVTHQLPNKWIDYPLDINQRMSIAVEHASAETEAMYNLMDYLFRERSTNRLTASIGADKLHELLYLEGYIKRRDKTGALKRIEDTFEVCKSIGICKDYKLREGAKGQDVYDIEINKDLPSLDKVYTVIYEKKKE